MAKLTRLQIAAAIAGIIGTGFGVLNYFKHSDPMIKAGPGAIAAGHDVTIGHLGDVITQVLPTETKPKHPLDEKLPGFATGLMIQINDITEERKKYQFHFRTPEGSKAEFYFSASNRYAFLVTDVHGSVYTLDIPLGSDGIPFEQFVYLFCEAGTASNYSYLRVLINGKQVARRDFDFAMELGSRRWSPVIGADENGRNGGAFMLMEIGAFSTTLSDTELTALAKNTLESYGSTVRQP